MRTILKFIRRIQAWITNFRLRFIRLIQAGMGIGVSSWSLANKTARHRGVLGTFSGVAAEGLVTRGLQQGDFGGHIREALRHAPFPLRKDAEKIINKYYVPGGIPKGKKFKGFSVFNLEPSEELQKLMILSAFALGWLSKREHHGLISMNLLEKIQMTNMYYIYGAMLAGVDLITMGAGIINQIPKVIDDLFNERTASYRVQVENHKEGFVTMSFDPKKLFGEKLPILSKPGVLAIVASSTLAKSLLKSCPRGIVGFVIEYPSAGGHNAPPRGRKKVFDNMGQPIYAEEVGEKDWVDLREFRNFGIPFWLAGKFASPENYKKARTEGATGVQVGTAFALCSSSGILEGLRKQARYLGYRGELVILTTLRSPTGYPFKVALLKGTMSEQIAYTDRKRVCSLCALRVPRLHENGDIVYLCGAEPLEDYEKKGGNVKDAEFMLCLCNGLFATVGQGNPGELSLVTLGDDVSFLGHLMKDENDDYDEADVIKFVLSR